MGSLLLIREFHWHKYFHFSVQLYLTISSHAICPVLTPFILKCEQVSRVCVRDECRNRHKDMYLTSKWYWKPPQGGASPLGSAHIRSFRSAWPYRPRRRTSAHRGSFPEPRLLPLPAAGSGCHCKEGGKLLSQNQLFRWPIKEKLACKNVQFIKLRCRDEHMVESLHSLNCQNNNIATRASEWMITTPLSWTGLHRSDVYDTVHRHS